MRIFASDNLDDNPTAVYNVPMHLNTPNTEY
jgi:hypothetical protein